MDKKIYDRIGLQYNKHRAADPRIIENVLDLLNLPAGSIIADIGAGTGNYTKALADLGYTVKAVEPSEEMRRQAAPQTLVQWYAGSAEAIPLNDDAVDGVMVILALHHFSSPTLAAKEIRRICPRGPIVVFTFDPRQGGEPWFKHYFPEAYQKDFISLTGHDFNKKIELNVQRVLFSCADILWMSFLGRRSRLLVVSRHWRGMTV